MDNIELARSLSMITLELQKITMNLLFDNASANNSLQGLVNPMQNLANIQQNVMAQTMPVSQPVVPVQKTSDPVLDFFTSGIDEPFQMPKQNNGQLDLATVIAQREQGKAVTPVSSPVSGPSKADYEAEISKAFRYGLQKGLDKEIKDIANNCPTQPWNMASTEEMADMLSSLKSLFTEKGI